MEKLTFSYIVSLFFVMTLGVFALIYTGEKEDLSNFEEVVINQWRKYLDHRRKIRTEIRNG